MILPEVSTYIVANTTGFVAGPSTGQCQVWLNEFPDQAQGTAVALFEAPGIEPQYAYSGIKHERPSLQVITRSTSYPTARTNANRIYALLGAVENATLTGTEYVSITPSQSPFDLGDDGAGRSMITCTYRVEKAVSAA